MSRNITYFISDLHLGATYLSDSHAYERRVVRWLESIKDNAKALYMLGDILDYWYEYRTVIPRGYIRFFGELARLADAGVEIYWFIGNHDIWLFDYLRDEIGLTVIDGYLVKEIAGKVFFMSHGDGLGKLKPSFRFIRSLFRNRICQKLYSGIHPRWTIPFALNWSTHSRNFNEEIPQFEGPDKEPLIKFSQDYLTTHPEINYFVYGHKHVLVDFHISDTSEVVILGDWIHHFSYGMFDGNEFKLLTFHEEKDK